MRFNFGRRFNLPRIGKANRYADSPEQSEAISELLPKVKDGEKHPLPFYKSQEITFKPFKDPPWKKALEEEEKERFLEYIQDPKVAKSIRDQLLKEIIDAEIIALASLSVTKEKEQETKNKEAAVFLETEVIQPVIQKEVLLCVWELLYDWGRNLSPQEFKEMQKRDKNLQMSSRSKELLNAHMLEGKDWSKNLTDEKQLSGERWEVLLYNYRAKLQQNSFKRNVALHQLQEVVVSQIAAEEVLKKGVVSFLINDMTELDETEKMKVPPRTG